MKNDSSFRPGDDGRDTRLDPMDAVPDATQPGSMMSPGAAADVLAQRSPQAPPPPLPPVVPQEVLFPAAEEIATPVGMEALRGSEIPSGEAPYRLRAPRLRTGWPFLPLAPLIVVIVGFAVALGIGLVGLDQLSRSGDEHAGARADLIAATVAARLAALPPARRLEATQLAARRSAAEMVVVTPQGEIIHDYTVNTPDPAALRTMLGSGRGVAEMRMGRSRYAVRPIGPSSDPQAARLVVLVPEPRAAEGANGLASALAALAVLLLGVAACVAYAVSRDVTRDVDFVTDRVRTMAQIRTEPTGELIPARTMDEVGILTATFNKLVGRFEKASAAIAKTLRVRAPPIANAPHSSRRSATSFAARSTRFWASPTS